MQRDTRKILTLNSLHGSNNYYSFLGNKPSPYLIFLTTFTNKRKIGTTSFHCKLEFVFFLDVTMHVSCLFLRHTGPIIIGLTILNTKYKMRYSRSLNELRKDPNCYKFCNTLFLEFYNTHFILTI